jgi:DNA-directed RNA polymerase subunit M/transcription elongation factor TFIIS
MRGTPVAPMFSFGQSTEADRREYARCHSCGREWKSRRIGGAWARAEAHDCPMTVVCECESCERRRATRNEETP